ncbi:MAG: hypothetical protein RSE41_06135 [Clostridia bacterium]
MSIFEGNRQDVIFDGKDLGMCYDLYVMDLDSNKENQFGIRRSITYNRDTFIKTDGERFVIEVTFAKIVRGIPQEIDEDDLDELILLFFEKDEPVTMRVEGRLYYVVPIEGSIRKIRNKYFTITLESVSPYCYSIPAVDRKRTVDSVRDLTIRNVGITEIYLDLEMEGKADKVVIRNKTNGGYIQINNFDGDIKIQGDTLEVFNWEYDRIIGNIKDTLKMKCGRNRFSVEVVGNVLCQFWHQCEMGLV